MGSIFFKDQNSGSEVPITAMREQFKEPLKIADSQWQKIYALSVFQRDIEPLNTQTVDAQANTEKTINIPLPNGMPEDLCGLKFRVYTDDPANPVPITTGTWAVTVTSLNGTVVTNESFNLANVNGIMTIRFSPRSVTGIVVTVTFTENTTFVLESHGRRCYNQEAFLEGGSIEVHADIDAPESAPLNVQPLQELVREDIVSATLDDTPIDEATLVALFDKGIPGTGFLTIPVGSELILNLKKPFNIKTLKFMGAGNLSLAATVDNIRVDYADGSFDEYSNNPEIIDDEITRIYYRNNNEQDDNLLYEIIGEIYTEQDVTNVPLIRGRNITYEETLTGGAQDPDVSTHDVYGDLLRPGHDGYVINDGDDDITVEVSDTEAGLFGSAITVKKGEILSLEKFDIWRLQISVAANKSASYRAVVL